MLDIQDISESDGSGNLTTVKSNITQISVQELLLHCAIQGLYDLDKQFFRVHFILQNP